MSVLMLDLLGEQQCVLAYEPPPALIGPNLVIMMEPLHSAHNKTSQCILLLYDIVSVESAVRLFVGNPR